MSLMTLSCGECGVDFCMPAVLVEHRKKDGDTFYCPNGHPRCYRPTEDEKRIEELERRVRNHERTIDQFNEMYDEAYASREDLISVVKECPFECGWHSRRQVPRDPVAMGRGIERVRTDLREHLLVDHRAVAAPQLALPERT